MKEVIVMKKAIDVSSHQGTIDWDKIKADGVEFAIIRAGFGDDIKSQDDSTFERNYTECIRVGIPCTIYLFSYALTEAHVRSEVEHIKRLMNGKKRNSTAPVYVDIENTKGLNWRSISDAELLRLMKLYKQLLNDAGYEMGIYSSRSVYWNEKMTDPWYENVSKWVAEYSSKLNKFTRPYDIWQYSSSGKVNGISGRVDMNWLYTDFSINDKKSINDLTQEILNMTTEAGYSYSDIHNHLNKIATVANEVLEGKWGNGETRKKKLASAGHSYQLVQLWVNHLVKRK
jgi:GH25 family lysozyme M1 (1,4-beta-N-acetylmuramidase)